MNSKSIKKIGSLILVAGLLFGCGVDNSDSTGQVDDNGTDTSDGGTTGDDTASDDTGSDDGGTTDVATGHGSMAVDPEADYSLEEMLQFAIEDEYAAHSEYLKIIDTYGDVAPFGNIVVAEQNHIDALTRLYLTYDYEIPADDSMEWVEVPESLLVAYETGVTAEIANIGMYETFLATDLPEDVSAVFTALQSASKNHLAAFNRQVAKYET